MEYLTIAHPMYEDRRLEAEHARRVLAMRNNGGWSLKKSKPRRRSSSSPSSPTNATNAATNKGDTVRSEEPDEDQAGG